jgi:hypothetical protein
VIQQELAVVVNEGLLLGEHAHRGPDPLARGGLGRAGLEDVLEAQLALLVGDRQQFAAELLQLLIAIFLAETTVEK